MKNSYKVILRRLGRQKTTTGLHVLGLTLGMTTCLLIGLFLRHELSYDLWNKKADRIYRINSVWNDPGATNFHYSTPMPLGPALREAAPGVEAVAQWHPVSEVIEINPTKRFKQEHIALADPELLDILDIKVLEGNGYEALRTPYQALLTQSTAKKFFGGENPMGKTFKYRNDFTMTVAGIIEDLPSNTHMPASMLISFYRDDKFTPGVTNGWSWVSGTETLVLLPEGTDPHSLDAPLKSLADKHINSDPHMPKDVSSAFDWQPLTDIHFNDKYTGGGEWVQAVNTTWLWFFGVIGLAVLLLACINFVNLSTAQALNRAKEVGVRKSVGAGQGQLVWQFLSEAWLLTAFAGLIAVVVTQTSLPYINRMVDKEITFNILQSPGLLGSLLLGAAITGLLAGLYPALVIARLDPVSSLKTSWANSPSSRRGLGGGLRKALVVTQFGISAALLIAVTLIAQQVHYLRSKDLGFQKDNIVDVNVGGQFPAERKTTLANEIRNIPGVKEFSFSTSTPSDDGHWGTLMSPIGREDPNRKEVRMILSDEHFAPMYGLKLLAGRWLEASDSLASGSKIPEGEKAERVVINRKAVETLGFTSPEDAIGKRFWCGYNSGHADVVGVMEDFNSNNLHEAIKPMFLSLQFNAYGKVGVKIAGGSDVPATIAAIGEAYKKAYPEGVYSYQFLDEKIDAFYKAEERLYGLFRLFAGLAMLISCLGLWGLATFAARQRTKEIGIRKVLGASVSGIVGMLSKEFLTLVILSLVIAVPLAWFGMNKWLQDFAYRVDIHWWVFALAGLVAVGIAFLTVSFQSVKAAMTNPVKSLRSE
ncbi:MAG: FtsX-like permease family protein [Bacteroidetes bacterium]|nr:FtsX-like permease family protein [Bacteroidota bacterium]